MCPAIFAFCDSRSPDQKWSVLAAVRWSSLPWVSDCHRRSQCQCSTWKTLRCDQDFNKTITVHSPFAPDDDARRCLLHLRHWQLRSSRLPVRLIDKVYLHKSSDAEVPFTSDDHLVLRFSSQRDRQEIAICENQRKCVQSPHACSMIITHLDEVYLDSTVRVSCTAAYFSILHRKYFLCLIGRAS